MPEDSDLIKPSNIRIEPTTKVEIGALHSGMVGGEYAAPFSAENPEGAHMIKVEDIKEGSTFLKKISAIEQVFAQNSQTDEFLPMLTQIEKEAVALRLAGIREKILNDPEYKNSIEKLLLSHEETHRSREVRFSLNKEFLDNEEFNQLFGKADPQTLDQAYQYLKTLTLVAIYDETEAVVGGVRNASSVDEAIRSDFLFLNASIVSERMSRNNSEQNYEMYLNYLYESTKNGNLPIFMPSHEMSLIMVMSEDGNLAANIANGKVPKEEFDRVTTNALRSGLTDTQRVVDNLLNSNSMARDVDLNLIRSIDSTKNIISEARNRLAA